MFIVGLTGGIGSGKTTVANLFATLNVPIIDADVIAKELTAKNTEAFHKIVTHFGQQIILEGDINRSKLREIIFHNQTERLWLERLLHPLIRIEMEKKITQLTSSYCIAVIPLLLEVEFYFFINRILVIDTSIDLQIERVLARDKMSRTQIEAILASQAMREIRLAKAHDVIMNTGSIDDLMPQVENLHKKYLEMSKK